MAKIISLINQKGGAGKTASTNAISVCLKHRGYRVLCVDFDPQGYLSFSMGAETRESPTIYDVLMHTVKCRHAIQQTPIIEMIPADAVLGNIDREFTGEGAERSLRRCLKTVSPLFDYILIDSPPQLGPLSINALVASDVALVPGLSDGYSLQGIVQVHETILRVKRAFNPTLVLGGMFLVRFYPREDLSQVTWETAQLLSQNLGMTLFDTRIRHSNTISKAMTSLQADIVEYAPRNTAVQDYKKLVNELFERGLL